MQVELYNLNTAAVKMKSPTCVTELQHLPGAPDQRSAQGPHVSGQLVVSAGAGLSPLRSRGRLQEGFHDEGGKGSFRTSN